MDTLVDCTLFTEIKIEKSFAPGQRFDAELAASFSELYKRVQ